MQSAAQLIPAATPQFLPAGGKYTQTQTVTITDATPGATIYYALHGVPPTTKSNRYTHPIQVLSTEGIEAIAVASGYTKSAEAVARYQIDLPPAATPKFLPPGGVYHTDENIRITDVTPNAAIYYTTDGSVPSTKSVRYTKEIPVTSHARLRAIAIAPEFSLSAIAGAQYVIRLDVAAPVFHPGGGSYSAAQNVKITDSTPGTAIFYTTDGHTPTAKSIPYTHPVAIPVSPDVQTLEAIAFLPRSLASPVTKAKYVITLPVATPTFFPSSGNYSGSVSVTLSDATEHSAIYYTTDGKMPTAASKRYSKPITVSSSETINAIAGADGSVSGVGSARYTITGGTSTPAISTQPALNGAVVVTLSSPAAGATIYYTLDGSRPTANSPIYAAPFLVDTELIVSAMATEAGQPDSTVIAKKFTQKIASGTLVWSDEFSYAKNENAAPNPQIWTYDTGDSGFGNQELENYCAWGSDTPPCATAEPNEYVGTDGYLHIVARNPVPGPPQAGNYTSARLKTQGLFSFRYGRLEVRAKVPEAQGFWPAAWLLGNDINTAGWPACGEMDVLERVNAAAKPDWNAGSIHGTGFTGTPIGETFNFPSGQTAAQWHTYGMIWSEGKVSYYIDNPASPYVTFTPASLSPYPGAVWPFDFEPSFILLNLAVGGSYPGSPDSTTPFPSEYVVDYVRIYAN